MQNNVIDQEKLFEICYYKIKGYLKPVLILLGESEHATNAFMRRLAERLQKEEETVVTYFAEENQETACSETLMEQLIYNIEEMCEVTKHFREAEEEGMKEPIIPSPVDAYRKKYLEYRNAYNDSKRNYIFSLLSLRNAEGYIFIEVPETMIFREYVGEIVKMFSNIPETKIKLILSYTGNIETEKSEEYLEDFPHIEIERIPAEGDNPTETDPICDREKKELTIELVKQAYDTRSEVLVGEIKEIIFREGEDFVVTWLQTMTPELTIKEENALHWLIKKLAAHEKTLELSAQMKTELLKRYETETGDGRTAKETFRLADLAIEAGLLWRNAYKKEETKRCYEKAWNCLDELYQKRSTTSDRCNFLRFYGAMEYVMDYPGNAKEDGFFERAKECLIELSRDNEFTRDLRTMSEYYLYTGEILKKDRAEEAMPYFIKALLFVQKEYEGSNTAEGLREIESMYRRIGEAIKRWGYGKYADAATYFEKSLDCIKKRYEQTKNGECLNELAEKYTELGSILQDAAEYLPEPKLEEEVLKYDREAVTYARKWHEATGTEASFSCLLQKYGNLRYTYRKMGKEKEEMLCANEVVRLCREAYETFETENFLAKLAGEIWYLGNCLYNIGQTDQAFKQYRNSISCREKRYDRWESRMAKYRLVTAYQEYAEKLEKCGFIEESVPYFKQVIAYSEQEFREDKAFSNWLELIDLCHDMEKRLQALGRTEEAMEYQKKAEYYEEM